MIVYLARDIPAFVMYCVNGASRSSLLIEFTVSMIYIYNYIAKFKAIECTIKFASLAIIVGALLYFYTVFDLGFVVHCIPA